MLHYLCVFAATLGLASGAHWAVLAAGSNQWYNYRHQADIYHAYQILVNHGVPKSNIITFQYDDIAHNPDNPTPGIVINKPNGPDVYNGVVSDYTKNEVTPENFLAALTGDSKKGKKVLQSGPDDHVFVFFADHGAPGFVAFPNGELKATDLNDAIKKMFAKRMYKQMVIYIEACESGSMFSGLLAPNVTVFATTASNPDESSYACYWDAKRQTYLGDLYSVNWMEDSDTANMNVEALITQFLAVQKKTNLSHVMEYGDKNFDREPIGEFQGNTPNFARTADALVTPRASRADAVRSENVRLVSLRRRIAAASANGELELQQRLRSELQEVLRMRNLIDTTFAETVHLVTGSAHEAARIMTHVDNSLINFECYNPLIDLVTAKCFTLPQNEWAMYRMHALVTLCREGYTYETISEALLSTCARANGHKNLKNFL